MLHRAMLLKKSARENRAPTGGWPSASVCQRHAGRPRAQLLAAGFGASRQSVVPRHRHPRCPRVVGEERQPPSASSCLVDARAAPPDSPEEVRQAEPSPNWTVCNTLPLSLAHHTHASLGVSQRRGATDLGEPAHMAYAAAPWSRSLRLATTRAQSRVHIATMAAEGPGHCRSGSRSLSAWFSVAALRPRSPVAAGGYSAQPGSQRCERAAWPASKSAWATP